MFTAFVCVHPPDRLKFALLSVHYVKSWSILTRIYLYNIAWNLFYHRALVDSLGIQRCSLPPPQPVQLPRCRIENHVYTSKSVRKARSNASFKFESILELALDLRHDLGVYTSECMCQARQARQARDLRNARTSQDWPSSRRCYNRLWKSLSGQASGVNGQTFLWLEVTPKEIIEFATSVARTILVGDSTPVYYNTFSHVLAMLFDI